MMTVEIHGQQLIGGERSGRGEPSVRVINPATAQELDPRFHEATMDEIEWAMQLAEQAFDRLVETSDEQRAALLEGIADQILSLGDQLLERCHAETALPMARLTGERARTVNQARLFAKVIREGSWLNARIDRALPDRTPLPKPDVRLMLRPVGPVVVFGASNFPLAISVAGSDPVSALAAGCPVVVKAHSSHPGTSELVGRAIAKAVRQADFPPGTFALLHGPGREVGTALVRHPVTRAVGFTGSWAGGKALFDAAVQRPEPIPVYAEMGSINPVFLMPSALRERGREVAEGFFQSMTLGVGQFCTQPGLAVALKGEDLDSFVAHLAELVRRSPVWTMLNRQICRAYNEGVERIRAIAGVQTAGSSEALPDLSLCQGKAEVLVADVETFLSQGQLSEEVFGPCSVLVACDHTSDFERVAGSLVGHLSATIHGSERELEAHRSLLRTLERKVGRVIFNGFPTGIEVCSSMHHGGPYPATTFSSFTSIGTNSILRWVRPVCYQNFPDSALPSALKNENPGKMWRLIDDGLTQEDV